MTMHVVKGSGGLHRRAFTARDVSRMVKARIIDEDEHVELVDGELIAMSPKGRGHDWVRDKLTQALFAAASDEMMISVEGTLQLDSVTLVEPDILVFWEKDAFESKEKYKVVPGASVLLAIEVAVSSLAYDRRRKAALYAAHGIPEYWVLDLNRPRAFVHRKPEAGSYGDVQERGGHEILRASAPELANLAVKLIDLF